MMTTSHLAHLAAAAHDDSLSSASFFKNIVDAPGTVDEDTWATCHCTHKRVLLLEPFLRAWLALGSDKVVMTTVHRHIQY
jgi:hypothetical protein